VPFTDGSVRPVLEDADGGQYVVDDASELVKGIWILADEPLIAGGLQTPSSESRVPAHARTAAMP
jgi:hypothetical protein